MFLVCTMISRLRIVGNREKVSNRCAQRRSDLKQFSSRDTIEATFIFLNLRNGQADHFAELPPGQAQPNATFSNPRSHMAVDRIGGRPSLPSRHALHPGGANSATSHVLSR